MEPGLLPSEAAVPVGATSMALMAWRHHGVLRVTVIAKATFAIACDTAMPRTRAQKIITAEVHHNNLPSKSVRLTTDLVPYLERADVLFIGSAFAPPGPPIESMHVRLGVYDSKNRLLDKTLLVRQEGGFREIPLVYERAYGGIGWADNPFGVGAANDVAPSILHPADPTRAAGFGPISQALPARKKLLKGARRAFAGDIPTLPDDLPWEYFHAAPPDQRIDWLRGDEWIVLDGLHPSLPSARTRLPGAHGQARVYGLEPYGVASGQPLDLHADVLRIDGDDRHVTVTFRGVFPVIDERALATVTVVAGVEMSGAPIAWPAAVHVRAPPPPPARPRSDTMVLEMPQGMATQAAPVGTHTIAEMPQGMASDKPALPFAAASSASPLAQPTSTPQESRWSGTLALDPAQEAAALQRDAIPFAGAAKPAPAPDAPPASAREPEPMPAPEPPAAAPPEPPKPVPSEPRREVSVGVAAPKETPAAPPPPKAAPMIKPAAPPALKQGLYGKFGGKR